MHIRALWLGASALALAYGGVAAAQTASGATPPASAPQVNGAQTGSQAGAAPAGTTSANSSDQVSEVVVTADRRTTNLQTTAVAATVLSQNDLLKSGVVTVDQLQFVTPSLTVNNFGQGNDIDVRGIGKGEHNSQTTTGVVTYRDGVATFPGYFQEEPFYDIANVQLLRGPQGTFSGQNATGGALIVNTADPKINGGYGGYALAHYGNYNDVGAQGAVNLPISDTLAARVALNLEHHDTFYNINGLKFGDPDINWASGRISLLWKPTSALSVLLKTDLNYLGNGGYFGDALTTTVGGVTRANPTNHLFDINTNYGTYAVDQFVRTSLKVDYVLPDGITLRSVTGYQTGRTGWKGDIDGSATAAPNYIIAEAADETLWSQEFNIISPTDTGPFSWIAGLYYDHNEYNFPTFVIGVPPGVFDEDLSGYNFTHSYAGFGQVNYKLPKGFEIQAGLRYAIWSTTNHVSYFVPEYGTLFTQNQSEREHGNNLTGKISLNWTYDDNNFFYGFVATGAKPGGLNVSVYSYPPVPIPAPFRQEYVTDYELGWKSSFFDRHLRTQLGFYYNDFDHFQLIVPLPNDPLHATEQNNPSTTTLYGFEGSAQAVFGALSANASIGIEKSRLGRVFLQDPRLPTSGTCSLQSGPATATCLNLEGNSQTYAPDLTANFIVQYDVKLSNGDTLTPSVNYAHISDQWSSLFENVAQGDHLAARDILGAALAWKHGPYVVTLYGYNLTDDQYVSANVSPIRQAGAPRQFGISVLRPF